MPVINAQRAHPPQCPQFVTALSCVDRKLLGCGLSWFIPPAKPCEALTFPTTLFYVNFWGSPRLTDPAALCRPFTHHLKECHDELFGLLHRKPRIRGRRRVHDLRCRGVHDASGTGHTRHRTVRRSRVAPRIPDTSSHLRVLRPRDGGHAPPPVQPGARSIAGKAPVADTPTERTVTAGPPASREGRKGPIPHS